MIHEYLGLIANCIHALHDLDTLYVLEDLPCVVSLLTPAIYLLNSLIISSAIVFAVKWRPQLMLTEQILSAERVFL